MSFITERPQRSQADFTHVREVPSPTVMQILQYVHSHRGHLTLPLASARESLRVLCILERSNPYRGRRTHQNKYLRISGERRLALYYLNRHINKQ
jgi:hypothetical protein